MTANELADKIQYDIELYIETDQFIFDECANMLRQQAQEIEDLKNANRFIQNFAEEQHQRAVALEMRELTDEEIVNILDEICGNDKYIEVLNMIIFARAILKKASEK